MRSLTQLRAGLILLSTVAAWPAHAIIFDSTGDVNFNTTAPGGALDGSGWQYEGLWGGVLGTPIAPHYFITAEHVGGSVGQAFTLQGTAYTTTAVFDDPATDLRIWQISGTFSTFAPLYTGTDEVGKDLVVIGRGTQRGSEVTSAGEVRGWNWGPGDAVERWGTNTVTATFNIGGSLGDLLIADFDHGASSTEAHLSSGDSGGAVFIRDTDDAWKLAGINYGVDGPFYPTAAPGGEFLAALYETSGFFYRTNAGAYEPASGPSAFYASRISSSGAFINSVLAPTAVPEPAAAVPTMVLLVVTALAGRGSRRRS